jgi:hypothetical protein
MRIEFSLKAKDTRTGYETLALPRQVWLHLSVWVIRKLPPFLDFKSTLHLVKTVFSNTYSLTT